MCVCVSVCVRDEPLVNSIFHFISRCAAAGLTLKSQQSMCGWDGPLSRTCAAWSLAPGHKTASRAIGGHFGKRPTRRAKTKQHDKVFVVWVVDVRMCTYVCVSGLEQRFVNLLANNLGTWKLAKQRGALAARPRECGLQKFRQGCCGYGHRKEAEQRPTATDQNSTHTTHTTRTSTRILQQHLPTTATKSIFIL